MAFWRSAAYVTRRLGREFLIWGAIALVLYLVADQLMLRRYEAALAAWTPVYNAHFSVPAPPATPCAGELDLLEAAKQIASQEDLAPLSLVSDKMLTVLASAFYLFDTPHGRASSFEENGFAPMEIALAEKVDDWSALLDAAAACGSLRWVDSLEPDAVNYDNEVFQLLRHMLAVSLVMMHEGDMEGATATLEGVGRLIPMMATPNASRGFLFQNALTEWLVAAVQYAVMHDAITPEAIEKLTPVLAALGARQPHPLRIQSPDYYERSRLLYPPDRVPAALQRLIRPYTYFGTASVLRLCLRLSDVMDLDNPNARAEAYRDLEIDASGLAEMWYSFFLLSIYHHELLQAEITVTALSLALEAEFLRTGRYPEGLEPLTAYTPEGFEPDALALLRLRYAADDDRMGYRITRRASRVEPVDNQQGGTVVTDDTQRWTRRRGE